MLISPPRCIGEVARDVAVLGPVSAIIEPSLEHHLGLAAARAAFPEARAFGPPRLERKIRGQRPVEPSPTWPERPGRPGCSRRTAIPVEADATRLLAEGFAHLPAC